MEAVLRAPHKRIRLRSKGDTGYHIDIGMCQSEVDPERAHVPANKESSRPRKEDRKTAVHTFVIPVGSSRLPDHRRSAADP